MADADSTRAPVLAISVSCDADHVSIAVRDTGVGISEEVRCHLFEPFFTTKDQGEGLGLGLTISSSIIQEFGGTLLADARSDGTVFTVRLKQATLRGDHAQ
jgi:two-component system C4-dicarboxylate transport sensor histidine kinase DctB